MPSLTSFKANNLFLRYKFRNRHPVDVSGKSEIEASAVATIGYLPGLDFRPSLSVRRNLCDISIAGVFS